MKNTFRNIASLLLVSTVLACDNYLDITPENEVTGTDILEDTISLNSFVLGIYTYMDFIISQQYPLAGLYADELEITQASASYFAPFATNDLVPENSNVQSLWQQLYYTVYKCNDVLGQLTSANYHDPAVANRYSAEAKFMRAYAYLTLVGYFGEVPLVTSTEPSETALTGRSTEAEVMELVVEDLEFARMHLPDGVVSESTRPNRYAASALLARAYLRLERFALAETECDRVINAGLYRLEAVNNVFSKASGEIIFQIWNANGYKLGAVIMPSADGVPTCSLNNGLLEAFHAEDMRKSEWTRTVTVGDAAYVYPAKYRKRNAGDGLPEEYTVEIRLAEVYLMRAEARMALGNTAGTVDDLNALRERANLSLLDSGISAPGELLELVVKERRAELFCEGAFRFFDLKRLGRIDDVLAEAKDNWNSYKAYYPIPNRERLINPNLTQNPGYPN